MKRTILFFILVFTLAATACQPVPMTGNTGSAHPEIDRDRIKNSTVLIEVEQIKDNGTTLAYAMGTLVLYRGEPFLVTHNHYGDMLQDMNIVEFRDAQNKMIRAIYGSEFKSLVIYQDAGTLVLRAPDGLSGAVIPGSLPSSDRLQQGDTVQVAYRGQPGGANVDVEEAVIEEVDFSHPAPVYKLRRLNGDPIAPGDSGGGVWYNGSLVGNTWSILWYKTSVPVTGGTDTTYREPTDWSNAAILPDALR